MFFFPKLVETKKSKFNGEIKVYKLFGKYSLSVNNLTQSGGLMYPIWKKALKTVNKKKKTVNNVLILGLGGGNAAEIVNKFWPQAKITGVEVDSTMIKLGKKYLSLNKIKNLKIVVSDAFNFTSNLKPKSYNLILIDTYRGKDFPPQGVSTKFLTHLQKLLAPQGMAIFNRLNWDRNDEHIEAHISSIQKVFPKVSSQKILSNTLIFCSKSM